MNIDNIIKESIDRFIIEEVEQPQGNQPMPDDIFEMLKQECEDYTLNMDYEKERGYEIDLDSFFFSVDYEVDVRYYKEELDYFTGTGLLGGFEVDDCNVDINGNVIRYYDYDTDEDVYYTLNQEQILTIENILINNAVLGDDFKKHYYFEDEDDYREYNPEDYWD